MKRIKNSLFLILMIMLIIVYPVCAEETNGYIVKLESEIVTLFSAGMDGVTPLGDKYYRVDSLKTAYEMFSESDIDVIIPDYQLELFDVEYPDITSDVKIKEQWNLDMIYANVAREKGVFGKGVKIAVIDSGLNKAHTDLKQANILQGYNCMENAEDLIDVSDNVGHGTSVCGIIAAQTDNQKAIAGIAGETYIIPLKITDTNKLSLSNIYMGIKKAIELDCDIINMSLGGSGFNDEAKREFKSWIDMANEAGIIVVAAVGNGGTTLNYPAAFDNVIGVGSVGKDKVLSTRSQRNESVFVVAPGDSVWSLTRTGGTAKCIGTSFATPHVTAAVALIKELKPDCDLNEIMELLKTTSEDLGDNGYDIYYGNGLLNIKSILGKLREYIPDVTVSQGMKDDIQRVHIHNNTDANIIADGYFAKHQDDRLTNLNVIQNVELFSGVTSLPFAGEYDRFMLWNKNLIPYTNEYRFE